MPNRKLRISAGTIIIAAVWLFYIYEYIVAELLTNGYFAFLLLCAGTFFGTRLLGFKFPK